MGSVIGKTLSKESGLSPSYQVLGAGAGYELRAYLSYVVAEVEGSKEPGQDDDCFKALAKVCHAYLCVFQRLIGQTQGDGY